LGSERKTLDDLVARFARSEMAAKEHHLSDEIGYPRRNCRG
jgi:hypothetical protein